MSRIGAGLLLLAGLERGDDEGVVQRLLQRLLAYRVFADGAGRMNLSVADVRGDILLVPQFTLAADTSRGRRPSFSSALPPDAAEPLAAFCFSYLERQYTEGRVAGGVFGADMQVSLINDGPVTFLLSS